MSLHCLPGECTAESAAACLNRCTEMCGPGGRVNAFQCSVHDAVEALCHCIALENAGGSGGPGISTANAENNDLGNVLMGLLIGFIVLLLVLVFVCKKFVCVKNNSSEHIVIIQKN